MDTHLLSNIQKLFSERIDIFSPVEFNKVRPWGHPRVSEVPELPTFLAVTCLQCPRAVGVPGANDQDKGITAVPCCSPDLWLRTQRGGPCGQ